MPYHNTPAPSEKEFGNDQIREKRAKDFAFDL
jgi:hypothetical protein